MQALSVINPSGARSKKSDGTGFAQNASQARQARQDVLDVRSKMLVSVLASIITIIISNLEGQFLLAVASFGYAFSFAMSAGRMRVLLWAYALVIVMGLMAMGCTLVMRSLLPELMGSAGYASLAVPFLRMLTMVHVIIPLALACRIQNMLDALRSLHLPFWLYLPAAVTIRFIPTFLHDIKQVVEALKLRGFKLNFFTFMRHPVLTLRLLFTPLLFRSLRTSEDLGIAAELKGLGHGERMVAYRSTQWTKIDSFLIFAALLVCLTALWFQQSFGTTTIGGMR